MKRSTLIYCFLLVSIGAFAQSINIQEALIPSGIYDMGDHFGFVDPSHPSDEIPIHSVKVDSFYMAIYETTNQQFLDFLDSTFANGTITVQNNCVYLTGDTNILCYTNQYEPWYSISFNGGAFSIADFRANHPMVGVMWCGAAAYCNWLSLQNSLQTCYNLQTWNCDFTKNGYRLPTEAEWEWAARGGNINPYFNYPMGDSIIVNQANLPNSGDPYEIGAYPNTTPVGFYNGTLQLKANFNWPDAASSYQTINGVNGFGLYDIEGNVWELINDWYDQNYYSVSPFDNPTGPATGFIMPDGKPYRGMRGGNWYNGWVDSSGVNNGHARVSNRNPSYYRGPLDPNHPWYHIGFRIARSLSAATGLNENSNSIEHFSVYPNPTNASATIQFSISGNSKVSLKVYNSFGQLIKILMEENLNTGVYQFNWNNEINVEGVYTVKLEIGKNVMLKKIILIK